MRDGVPRARAQVFVVGQKTAAAMSIPGHPTHLPLPGGRLSERGRLELVRNLESEQGFAHRALPMGAGLTLEADGPLRPVPSSTARCSTRRASPRASVTASS